MTTKKNGDEPFSYNGSPLGVSLLDFWQWQGSDLISNIYRGLLAEFIVAYALGIDLSRPRQEWMPYDLITNDGIKIEVKSTSSIQTWTQKQASKLQFRIAPTRMVAKDGTYVGDPARHADIYVFCVFSAADGEEPSPMSLDQWSFYVASTKVLDEQFGGQRTICLSMLMGISTGPLSLEELKNAIVGISSG